MDISEFITQTLNQICEGIRNAKTDQHEQTGNEPLAPCKIGYNNLSEEIQLIKFDISAVVTDSSQKEGGIKIQIPAFLFGASGAAQASQQSSFTQRIQFSVPFVPSACDTRYMEILSPKKRPTID